MLRRLAGRGHHLEARLRPSRADRRAAHAARGPGDQDGPVAGVSPWRIEPAQREEGGEAGQADDGGVAAAEPVGQRHDPLGRDPGVGGEAAVAGHPEVVALHEHALARGNSGLVALLDAARQLHARDERDSRGPRGCPAG